MQLYDIYLKVKITLLSEEAGGRRGYISSNYRPFFSFDEIHLTCDGSVIFEDKNQKLYPGETARGVVIRLVSTTPFENNRPVYFSQFFMKEGNRIIGQGIVTKVIKSQEPQLMPILS